ncbi:hypothetical protein P3T76_009535 [Phytophthora citrophthora]|uniref:RxLR effector protein n=1 Tax=Phytophthora citrophthora TaxID=4793 RepID=A0AAD9GG82_9STRA|nr:hypothetical protein P3T76_009535 [Phytophthora citrophthora]
MRASVVLFLAATALIAVVSGSSANLRTSQEIESSDAAPFETNGRELRGDFKTDEASEDRMNLSFLKGDSLKSFAKSQAKYVYTDDIFKELAKKFDPDTLHTTLKLYLPKNRSNKYGVKTSRYNLYQNFLVSYVDKNPHWRSTLN